MSRGIKCIEVGCLLNSVKYSRCAYHAKQFDESRPTYEKSEAFAGSSRRERLPGNWASLRRSILERDSYTCYICGGPGADSVDHVVAGDNHHPSNLKAAHQNVPPFCHRIKSAQEGAAASKRARAENKENKARTERFSALVVRSVINRNGDTCVICGGVGADYVARKDRNIPPIASNIQAVHYYTAPNCVLTL